MVYDMGTQVVPGSPAAIPLEFQEDAVLSPVLAKLNDLFGSLLESGSSRQNHKNVNVFDSYGFSKRELTRKQKHLQESVHQRGPRYKRYVEDAVARSKSRRNHIDGLCRKIRDLKITTGHETIFMTKIQRLWP